MELSDIAQGKSSKKEFLDAIENEIKEGGFPACCLDRRDGRCRRPC